MTFHTINYSDFPTRSGRRAVVRSGNTRCHAVAGLLCCLLLSAPLPAWAADDVPPPAPRTTLQIGDASIVLIAANDQLYAFVDRVEDNAPVIDADLTIASSDARS